MKLFKTAKTLTAVTSVLSVAMLATAISGCGDATTSTSPTTSSSFTVTPGSYIRYATKGDGKMSLTLTGVDMDLDRDSQPLIYFYDEKGYGGGRTTGGFQGDLRNYKLKYYNLDGSIASESYHGSRFRSTESYDIVLEWKTGAGGYVRSTIDGKVFEKPGQVAESFTVGIGYPPAARPGWEGATYTNIVWPKGSTEVK